VDCLVLERVVQNLHIFLVQRYASAASRPPFPAVSKEERVTSPRLLDMAQGHRAHRVPTAAWFFTEKGGLV